MNRRNAITSGLATLLALFGVKAVANERGFWMIFTMGQEYMTDYQTASTMAKAMVSGALRSHFTEKEDEDE